MLKRYEQPSVIKDTYRGRLHATGLIQMSGVEDHLEKSQIGLL
jgi:glucosamine--fructose-6-phosphate aminotransferase (isomerizing)